MRYSLGRSKCCVVLRGPARTSQCLSLLPRRSQCAHAHENACRDPPNALINHQCPSHTRATHKQSTHTCVYIHRCSVSAPAPLNGYQSFRTHTKSHLAIRRCGQKAPQVDAKRETDALSMRAKGPFPWGTSICVPRHSSSHLQLFQLHKIPDGGCMQPPLSSSLKSFLLATGSVPTQSTIRHSVKHAGPQVCC